MCCSKKLLRYDDDDDCRSRVSHDESERGEKDGNSDSLHLW